MPFEFQEQLLQFLQQFESYLKVHQKTFLQIKAQKQNQPKQQNNSQKQQSYYTSKKCKKKEITNVGNLLCGGADLNGHDLRHKHLKLACLPIPPPPRNVYKIYQISRFVSSGNIYICKTFFN